MYLPWMKYSARIPDISQIRFGGIERGKASKYGSIFDMQNISTEDFPLLSATPNRKYNISDYDNPWYYGVVEKEYVIAGKTLGENYTLWNSETTYNDGKIVAYDGVLYISNKNNPAGEPSTSEDWTIYTKTTFSYDGVWSSDGVYSPNDVVYHSDLGFIRNLNGKTPVYPSTGDDWRVAEEGKDYTLKISWSSSASFAINDVVPLGGHYYIKISDSDGIPGESKAWKCIDWQLGKNYSKGEIIAYVPKSGKSVHFYIKISDDSCNWEPYSYATLYYDGEAVTGLELIPGKKECAYLNGYIVIIPDNMFYRIDDGTFGYISGTKSGKLDTRKYRGIFYNNKKYDYPLVAGLCDSKESDGYTGSLNKIKLGFFGGNTLMSASKYSNIDLTKIFRDGDVIEVNQIRQKPHDEYAIIVNGSYVVQKVKPDELIFTTSSFAGAVIGDDALIGRSDGWYYLGDIIISKGLPEIDYLCVANNRMWGCHNDTVYSSALGDVFSWQRYSGLETDPVYLETADIGSFTGCIEYGGYPTFFKENEMYRVYGSTASTFSLQKVSDYGLRSDSPHAICIVDSVLFFLSQYGVCAYSGGIPAVISDDLKRDFSDGIFGTDGKRLYACVNDGTGNIIYVYDVKNRIWSSETIDNKPLWIANLNGELRTMDSMGNLLSLSKTSAEWQNEADTPTAYIEFNDFYEDTLDDKKLGGVVIRASVDPKYDALEVFVQYDSDGIWHKVGSIYNQSTRKKVTEFRFFPVMCDHYRLKLQCNGKFTLYTIARQIEK